MTQLFYVEQILLAVTETCYVKIFLIIVTKKFLFEMFKLGTLYQRKFMSVLFPYIVLVQRYDVDTNDICVFIFERLLIKALSCS